MKATKSVSTLRKNSYHRSRLKTIVMMFAFLTDRLVSLKTTLTSLTRLLARNRLPGRTLILLYLKGLKLGFTTDSSSVSGTESSSQSMRKDSVYRSV